MKIEVQTDTTRREIGFRVTEGSAPDLDVTESWHSKPRVIRPDSGNLVIVDGEVRRITVSGGLVLKSGAASEQVRDKREWRASHAYMQRERIEDAPEWVQYIWREAQCGVTAWSYVERDNAEQVQAL